MSRSRLCLAALFASALSLGSIDAFALPPGPPPSNVPTPPISEEAKRHFHAGVALLQDPEGEKVEEAYRQFKTAYDLSGSSKILGNMGFCAMRLERDSEAIDAYTRYLREVPDIDPEERAQILRDLETLNLGISRVSIEVNLPDVTIIDERVPNRGPRITNAYGPVTGKIDIGIRPGRHIFTARRQGSPDQTWELETYAGSKDHHAFVLEEPAKPEADRSGGSGVPVGPIVVTSIGGAMLIGGAITGAIALGKTGDIADQCPNDVCPRGFGLEDRRSEARTFVTVTDVLLIVGALAVAGGVYWGYRELSAKPEPAKADPPQPQPSAARRFLSDWRLAL